MDIIGYDKGGNIKATIEGQPYIFATMEGYGGTAVYGVCFPGDDFFTMLSKSKKANKLYNTFAGQITEYLEKHPDS